MLEIVEKIKSDNTFFFYRGRVALYAVLKAMGVKEGDGVILQAFTCLAVPSPVVFLKAKPVYIDIEPKTYNIDVSKIEDKITKKTKAIIVQHTFGVPAEMDKIIELSKKYNLYLIEDCCHAYGSEYKGKEIGTFGDVAFFSYEWGKPLIIGLGGALVVNNPEIKKEVEKIYPDFAAPSLKETIIIHLQYVFHSLLVNPFSFWVIRDIYRFFSRLGLLKGTFAKEELIGRESSDYAKKMSGFHQKVLLKKIKEVDKNIAFRKSAALKYGKLLEKACIKQKDFDDKYRPVYLRYPLLVWQKEKIINQARKKKIELGDWFVSVVHPLTGKDLARVGYLAGSCPVAEDIAKKIITLPIYKKVNKKSIEKAVNFLSENKEKIIQYDGPKKAD